LAPLGGRCSEMGFQRISNILCRPPNESLKMISTMWRLFEGLDSLWRNTRCYRWSNLPGTTLQAIRKKTRKGNVRMRGIKEKTNPRIVDQEGSLAPRNPNRRTRIRVKLLSIQTRKTLWKVLPLLLLKQDLKRASVLAEAWTTTQGSSAENQLWLHPPEAKSQKPKMTIQKMSHLWQEQLGITPRLRSLHLDEFTG